MAWLQRNSRDCLEMAVAAEEAVRAPLPYTGPHPPFDLTTLDEKQRGAFEELRDRLPKDLTAKQKLYVNDFCLIRYLRARDWHVDQAEKLLLGSLEWRLEVDPDAIHIDTIAREQQTAKIYLNGTDREGRPAIYQKPRYQNTTNYDEQVQQSIYTLERSVNSMDASRGVTQHHLITDFKGYSMFNAPPMHVTKRVLSVLMDRYPERLAACFFVDAPFLFSTVYKIIKAFLPEATKRKIFFVSRKGKSGDNGRMDPAFAKFFDAKDLEVGLGGDKPDTYDPEIYIENEREAFRIRQQYVKEMTSRSQTAGADDDSPKMQATEGYREDDDEEEEEDDVFQDACDESDAVDAHAVCEQAQKQDKEQAQAKRAGSSSSISSQAMAHVMAHDVDPESHTAI
eukprot:m.269027 g.269027  ORF g.269027 m.269027 type:complete len:396 (-) comp15664_c0_seq4:3295-4482(-)